MTRRRRVVLAGGAVGIALFCVTVPVVPATSNAADAEIGGFDNFSFAAPVSILVYEQAIPIPNTPQGELRYSYSESRQQAGPFGSALASSVYPGPTLATGLPQFNENLPQYPVVTTATYPGTPEETQTSKNVGPGQMSASAKEFEVTARSETGSSSDGVVTFGQMSSRTVTTYAKKKVTSNAVARVSDLGLMGEIIHIASVRGESHTESNGTKGTTSGSQTVSGLTIAGQKFRIDEKGVHPPETLQVPGLPLPGLPKSGAQLLKQLGLTITVPEMKPEVNGTTARIAGQALLISIDTTPFKKALSRLPIQRLIRAIPNNICVPDGGQIPFGSCLHENLDGVLNLSPRVDFLIANTASVSNGVPVFIPTFPPTDPADEPKTTTIPGQPGTPGTPGTSGTPGLPGSGGTTGETPTVAAPLQPVANLLPSPFSGIGAVPLFLGLLAIVAGAYAMRAMGLPVVLGAASGCEYGAPGGVPDLRRG